MHPLKSATVSLTTSEFCPVMPVFSWGAPPAAWSDHTTLALEEPESTVRSSLGRTAIWPGGGGGSAEAGRDTALPHPIRRSYSYTTTPARGTRKETVL